MEYLVNPIVEVHQIEVLYRDPAVDRSEVDQKLVVIFSVTPFLTAF